MKIIVINNLYAPWVRGGAERIAEKTVEGLEKAGHEVFVISTAPKESRTEKIYYLPSIFYNLDKYPLWQRFFWHLWDIFNFSNAEKIKKILREFKPDLVITNNLQGVGFLVPGLLRQMKVRHIHTLHDIQLLHPSGLMMLGKEKNVNAVSAKIYQLIIRFLFGSPAVVISSSRWLLAEHEKRGFFAESEKNVLPNYSLRKKTAPVADSKSTGGNFKFLYVGLLENHKGVKFLVETFLKFWEKNSSAELTIVGSGSQLEELKQIAGDKKEIKILGRKSEEEVWELMSSADCFIMPSLCYENSPTVIYEAIAAQLPVIGAKIGGITELLEAAGGLLFTPGNINDLEEKMQTIFKSAAEREKIIAKEKSWLPADYIGELVKLAKV
jgi:glycosyltransferase involved in cell wall biosynthesis